MAELMELYDHDREKIELQMGSDRGMNFVIKLGDEGEAIKELWKINSTFASHGVAYTSTALAPQTRDVMIGEEFGKVTSWELYVYVTIQPEEKK